MDHPVAVLIPVTATISPTALVVGRVNATVPALLAIYPLLDVIAWLAPVITDHVRPAPTALIVNVPAPVDVVIPVPAVIVAAAGSAPVEPISI